MFPRKYTLSQIGCSPSLIANTIIVIVTGSSIVEQVEEPVVYLSLYGYIRICVYNVLYCNILRI